ncbi:15557_t:CDS:2 [Rhizophagus irregularis]|nr:15557_t:CDS:2 [Rhizophagus irregularis]
MVSGIELISVLRLAHKLIVGLISNARLANNIIPKAEELEDRIVRLIEIFNNHISEEDGEIMSRYYYLIKDEIIPFFERFNKKGRIKKFVNVRDDINKIEGFERKLDGLNKDFKLKLKLQMRNEALKQRMAYVAQPNQLDQPGQSTGVLSWLSSFFWNEQPKPPVQTTLPAINYNYNQPKQPRLLEYE